MKGLLYWMIFQIILGIWLFVSPFVLGFMDDTRLAVNNMVLGVLVTILSFVVLRFGSYCRDVVTGHRAKATNL